MYKQLTTLLQQNEMNLEEIQKVINENFMDESSLILSSIQSSNTNQPQTIIAPLDNNIIIENNTNYEKKPEDLLDTNFPSNSNGESNISAQTNNENEEDINGKDDVIFISENKRQSEDIIPPSNSNGESKVSLQPDNEGGENINGNDDMLVISTNSPQKSEESTDQNSQTSIDNKHDLSKPIIDDDNKLNETVLHLAARHNRADVIEWLIKEKKVDIEIKDAEGFTPWLRAVEQGKKEAVLVLNIYKCSQVVENNLGENAANFIGGYLDKWTDFKCWVPDDNTFSQLISPKNKQVVVVKKESKQQTRKTVFHPLDVLNYVCQRAKPGVLEDLFTNKLYKDMLYKDFINEPDNEGNTPLFYAIQYQDDKNLPKVIDVFIKNIPFLTRNTKVVDYKNQDGFTPWLLAVKLGKLDAANCLRKHEANMLCENNIGENGVHLIVTHLKCWEGNEGVVKYIPQKEVDILVTKKNKYEENALHYACEFASHFEVVQQLSGKHPQFINQNSTRSGWSPIFYILINKNIGNDTAKEFIGALLAQGSQVINSKGESILQIACKTENISSEIVKVICDKSPELVVKLGPKKQTPVFYAIRYKQSNEVIKVLIEKREFKPHVTETKSEPVTTTQRVPGNKKNPKKMNGEDDFDDVNVNVNNFNELNSSVINNPLSKARHHERETNDAKIKIDIEILITDTKIVKEHNNGDKDIRQTAITKTTTTTTQKITKVDINYKDKDGNTPWLFAIRCGNLKAANYLRQQGADVTCVNKLGENAVHLIVGYLDNWDDIKTYIPERTVENLVNQPNNNDKTILHYACEKAKHEVVKTICQLYSDLKLIEAVTKDNNWTPIFYAIKSRQSQQIIQILINDKADIEHKDTQGFTPWLRCIEGQYIHGAKTLWKKRAILDCRNAQNENALHFLTLVEPKDQKDWLPVETRNNMLVEEYKNNFTQFMQRLFKTAINSVTGVQLPENYALIAFRFNSYPKKETTSRFGYAIIVDKMTRDVELNLKKVCKTFELLISENTTRLKNTAPPTCFALINTPYGLVKDLLPAKFVNMSVVSEVLTILDSNTLEQNSLNQDKNSIISTNSNSSDKNLVTEFSEEVKYAIKHFLNYTSVVAEKILFKLDQLHLNINLLLQLYNAEKQQPLVQQQYWDAKDKNPPLNASFSIFKECDPTELGASWLIESFYSTIVEHGVGKTTASLMQSGDLQKEESERKQQQSNFKLQKLMRTVPLVEGQSLDLYLNPVQKNKNNDPIKEGGDDIVQVNPDDLDNLDMELFCETVFFSYITNQENTAKDFVLHKRKDGKLQLVNIKNICGFSSAWHSPLYTLPQMKMVIPQAFIEKMLNFNSAYSLTQWLLNIEVQYRQMQTIDKKFIIPITENIVELVYENWLRLREVLITEKDLTLAKVVSLLQISNKSKVKAIDTVEDVKLTEKFEKKREKDKNIKSEIKVEVEINKKNLTMDDFFDDEFELVIKGVETGFFGPKAENALKKLQQLENDWDNLQEIRQEVENGTLSRFKKLCDTHKEIVLFGSKASDLQGAMDWAKAKDVSKLIDYLIKEQISFYKIHITDCKDIEAKQLIELCACSPYMIKLELGNTAAYYENTDSILLNIFNTCPAIEELTLINTAKLLKIGTVFTSEKLRMLTITSSDTLQTLELKTPALTSVTLDKNTKLEKITLTSTPCLSEITISGCNNFETLENADINNVLRVIKFDIESNNNSKLADSYQTYPFLMLYSAEGLDILGQEAVKFTLLFDKYKYKIIATIKQTGNDEVKEMMVFKDYNNNKEIDNKKTKLCVEKIAISQKALEYLDYFNQAKIFYKKLEEKASEIQIYEVTEVIEKSDEYHFEKLYSLLIDGNEKSKKTVQRILGCDEKVDISDKNLLEILKNCLKKCDNETQAKHFIKLALAFVKLDYKKLSNELYDSLPEKMKAQHAELGLLGIAHPKNILIHQNRLKTDDSACLALIALGHAPEIYEINLLYIILSNPSPIMVWRALEQLAKIYPHIAKIYPKTIEYSNNFLSNFLIEIYQSNNNLLLQSLPVIKEMAKLHNANKSLLENNTLKTRIGCILSTKNKEETSVTFFSFNKCLLEKYSVNNSNEIESNDSCRIERETPSESFMQGLIYREFEHVVKNILPNIRYIKQIDTKQFEKITGKHVEFYLRMLAEQLCADNNKKDQGKFIQALKLIESENQSTFGNLSGQHIFDSLNMLCKIENKETKDLSIKLHQIFVIIKSIADNQSNFFLQVSRAIVNTLNKVLLELVSEKSLDDLHNDFLPNKKSEEAANAISNILSYKSQWINKIVAPLKEKTLIKTFLEEPFAESSLSRDKIFCIFEILIEERHQQKNGIKQFSKKITEIMLFEIDNFMQSHENEKLSGQALLEILLKLQYLISGMNAKLPQLAQKIEPIIKNYVKKLQGNLKTFVGMSLLKFNESQSKYQIAASILISNYFEDAKNMSFDKKTKSQTSEKILKALEIGGYELELVYNNFEGKITIHSISSLKDTIKTPPYLIANRKNEYFCVGLNKNSKMECHELEKPIQGWPVQINKNTEKGTKVYVSSDNNPEIYNLVKDLHTPEGKSLQIQKSPLYKDNLGKCYQYYSEHYTSLWNEIIRCAPWRGEAEGA